MKKLFLGFIITTVLISQAFAQTHTDTEGGGDIKAMINVTNPNPAIAKMMEEEQAENLRLTYHAVFREWADYSIKLFSLLKYLQYPFENQILVSMEAEKLKEILKPFLEYDVPADRFSLDDNLSDNGNQLTFYSSPQKVIMNPKRWLESYKAISEREGRKAIAAALATFIHEAFVIEGIEQTLDYSVSAEVSNAFYTLISDPNGWRIISKLPTIKELSDVKTFCSKYNTGLSKQDLYRQLQFVWAAELDHKSFRKKLMRMSELHVENEYNLLLRHFLQGLSIRPIHNVPLMTNSLLKLINIFEKFDEECFIPNLPPEHREKVMSRQKERKSFNALSGQADKKDREIGSFSW